MKAAKKTVARALEGRTALGMAETAGAFGISRDVLDKAIREGRLRSIKIGERRLIPASEIERICEEGL